MLLSSEEFLDCTKNEEEGVGGDGEESGRGNGRRGKVGEGALT
jgi:hypothetical protein